MPAFKKDELDALKSEFESHWKGTDDYEDLVRDLHLGIAYYDADQPLKDIDPRAVELIQKHAPSSN